MCSKCNNYYRFQEDICRKTDGLTHPNNDTYHDRYDINTDNILTKKNSPEQLFEGQTPPHSRSSTIRYDSHVVGVHVDIAKVQESGTHHLDSLKPSLTINV